MKESDMEKSIMKVFIISKYVCVCLNYMIKSDVNEFVAIKSKFDVFVFVFEVS